MPLKKDADGNVMQLLGENGVGVGYAVNASNVTAQSPAINTNMVEIWCPNTNFAYAVGANPTAVVPVSGTPGTATCPAGVIKTIFVGKGNKVAVILASGTDTVYITEKV